MFSIYLYKSTLSSARAAGARKAALNAVVRCLNEHGEAIERQFGSRKWLVVLLYAVFLFYLNLDTSESESIYTVMDYMYRVPVEARSTIQRSVSVTRRSGGVR
jgi:hypothetical protein